MSEVRLTDTPVIDVHLHGFDPETLLKLDPSGWQDRITLLGMCMQTATSVDSGAVLDLEEMIESSVFALIGRRWLAEYLQCDVADVPEVRHAQLSTDPQRYLTGLMRDEYITGFLVDDGYPLPKVNQDDMSELVGVDVHRVARIEPMIDELRTQVATAAELEDAYRATLHASEGDSRCVAYKSVIAYRTGLDIQEWSFDDVASSFDRWRDADWQDARETSKPLRDHLLGVTLEVAKGQGRPVHIHSGAGDPDVVLAHARPTNLAPTLARFNQQPIVLIHSGFPWATEAAYLASIYPGAYLDLSIFIPWATMGIDSTIETVLGMAPTSKVMYGSDEASEPEVAWLSARMGRAALERVLGGAVDKNLLTRTEAERIGHKVLYQNAARLHGIADE